MVEIMKMSFYHVYVTGQNRPIDLVTDNVSALHGNFHCSFPGGVHAHHGLFRVRAFETPATFYIVVKSHWTV